jgi:alpha-galactosidase
MTPEQILTSALGDETPFSFVYGGKPSRDLLPGWERAESAEALDAQRMRRTTTWRDPATGLEVRCERIEYAAFPTVEWTVYFRNTGAEATPILEDIQALDTVLQRGDSGEFLLHHALGSACLATDYQPLETPLPPGASLRLAPEGGRGSNGVWPYFSLDWGGQGLIVVIGWPGQWTATFARDGERGLHVRAGQELTHFKLLPGEEVRSPLIVLQGWSGDWIAGQNVWRRWMVAHSMPRPGGEPPPPLLFASSSRAYEEMIGANEENQIMFMDLFAERGIRLDYWWMDAGWYPPGGQWWQVGTWEVDPARFPRGFRPISDHAHAQDLKILVWFEPERVSPGSWLADDHPEWIIWREETGLLNLGNEAARQWLTEHVDGLLTSQGIDLYRQDHNFDPLEFWRQNDAPDRQGITEIGHVTGYLAYWDELRRRHPGMLIDSCASGGRRNDLETMRRAVTLWRSDYASEAAGHQGMTYGLAFWLPYQGTGTVAADSAPYYGGGATPVEPYAFWSNTSPSLGLGMDAREAGMDWPALGKLVAQWRRIGESYYGDYYPLTPYSLDNTRWIAWQFHCPERGAGMLQAFRRPECAEAEQRLPLRGLDPAATYLVTDLAAGTEMEASGEELTGAGLLMTAAECPQAVVLTYERRLRRR